MEPPAVSETLAATEPALPPAPTLPETTIVAVPELTDAELQFWGYFGPDALCGDAGERDPSVIGLVERSAVVVVGRIESSTLAASLPVAEFLPDKDYFYVVTVAVDEWLKPLDGPATLPLLVRDFPPACQGTPNGTELASPPRASMIVFASGVAPDVVEALIAESDPPVPADLATVLPSSTELIGPDGLYVDAGGTAWAIKAGTPPLVPTPPGSEPTAPGPSSGLELDGLAFEAAIEVVRAVTSSV